MGGRIARRLQRIPDYFSEEEAAALEIWPESGVSSVVAILGVNKRSGG